MVSGFSTAGHGPNLGHGWVKHIVIGDDGQERPPVVFPAIIGRAGARVAGAIQQTPAVLVGTQSYWTGEDALLSPSPQTLVAQERLGDPTFIPALLKGALARLGGLNGAATGFCVSGLPANWASSRERCSQLGQRIREAGVSYQAIRVIPEPLGLIYAQLLDNNGQIAGDPALQTGNVGVADLGHHTDDLVIVNRMRPISDSLQTFQLGTSRPLQRIRAMLSTHFEREMSLYEVDMAIRQRGVREARRLQPLPLHWDRPLIDNGEELAARMVEAWGRGTQLDAIVLGGGGAELEQKCAPVLRRFPHAVVVEDPQLAIARGYARLARREALAQR